MTGLPRFFPGSVIYLTDGGLTAVDGRLFESPLRERMMKQSWTADELDLLTRLRLAAAMQTPDAMMALGTTEAGDPWCTIFSPQTGEVLINIARIAGDYIRMPGSHAAVRSDDLGACIESFLMLRTWRRAADGSPAPADPRPQRRH